LELAPGVWRLPIPNPGGSFPFVNSYLIRDADGFLLVDCGIATTESGEALDRQLGKLGVPIDAIHTFVATHGHLDHYGQAPWVRERSGAQVALHGRDLQYMRARYGSATGGTEVMQAWLQRYGFDEPEAEEVTHLSQTGRGDTHVQQPDLVLRGGEQLGNGKYRYEVLSTPGHTPGHINLYEPERGLLFCGDHILDPIAPNISLQPHNTDNPIGSYLRSLNTLKELPIKLTLPGHGEPITDLRARCEQILSHQLGRRDRLRTLLDDQPRTAYELGALVWPAGGRRDWSRFTGNLRRNAVGTLAAHLEGLVGDELAERLDEDVVRYRRAAGAAGA
jgi:glyoxylase-like metal-dependent hydrolase (beta-lactamase superfamily II)